MSTTGDDARPDVAAFLAERAESYARDSRRFAAAADPDKPDTPITGTGDALFASVYGQMARELRAVAGRVRSGDLARGELVPDVRDPEDEPDGGYVVSNADGTWCATLYGEYVGSEYSSRDAAASALADAIGELRTHPGYRDVRVPVFFEPAQAAASQ